MNDSLLLRALFLGMDGDSQLSGSEISAHMAALYLLARLCNYGHVVECGVGRGWSTLALLLGVVERRGCLTSFDHDEKSKASAMESFRKVGIRSRNPILQRWTHVVKSSVNAALEMEQGSVALLFIDTDHSEDYSEKELNTWLPKMHPQGIICGHDYYWEVEPGQLCGVKAAVDRFVLTHNQRFRLQVLRHDNGLFILWPNQ